MPFFFLAALVSEIAGTVAGFGSSTVFLPLALFFVDFKSALVLVAFLHIFGNLARLNFFRRGLDVRLLVKFGLPGVLFSLIGALLVSAFPPSALKFALGLFLVVYSLFSFWQDKLRLKPTGFNLSLGGGLSGFLAGLIGTGGALRSAFLTAFGLPKDTYLATSAAAALAVDLTRIPVYLSQGFLEKSYYPHVLLLLIVAFLGSYLGKLIVTRIPQPLFRKIVLLALLVMGVYLLNG